MKKLFYGLSLAAAIAAAAVVVSAQGPPPGSPAWIHIPASTIERLGDVGFRAHTNHLIRVGPQAAAAQPSGQYPAKLWSYYTGLTPANSYGSQIIAIVDAYHFPTALNDFNVFADQFGLPRENGANATDSTNKVFQVVYATTNGQAPATDCGWAQEAALDIQWAHAMAPNAKIVLVEAASNSYTSLFAAVQKATTIVKTGGGSGQVSMSWGGAEFSTETGYDTYFPLNNNVVYIASSGDSGGKTIYPSVSGNVIAAGGTTLVFSGSTITGEKGWSGSGGGPSRYEPAPDYQDFVKMPARIGNHRGSPDISFDADPYTGVAVYDSTVCQGMSGWMVFGGTSVSAPALAGLINSAGHFAADASTELDSIYRTVGVQLNYTLFHDVTSGRAGSYKAGNGWDYVTGIGTPKSLSGM